MTFARPVSGRMSGSVRMGGRKGEPKWNPMKRPMATTAIPTPRDMAHVGRGR